MSSLLDNPHAARAAARGAALRVAGHVAGVALAATAAALLYRHLGVSDAGRFVAATSLAAMAVQVVDAGLTSVATRELSKGAAGDGSRLLDELLGVRIVFGVAGVTIATAAALALGWSAAIVLGTLLAGLAVLIVGVAHNVGALLGSRLRWGRVAVTDLARAATAAAATAVLVIADAGTIAFFAALLLGAVVALAVAIALTGHLRLPDLRGGLARWRALGKELLPLAAATAVAVVYLRVVMVLTAVLTPAHETGTFAAAFRVVEVIAVVPVLVAGSMLPVLARAAQEDRRRHAATARRAITICAGLGVALTTVLAVTAPVVIAVIGGPDFGGSVRVLRVEAIALGIAFVNVAITVTLLSLDLHREMLTTALTGLVAVTAATLLLAPSHGAIGSAAATVIGEAVWLAGALALVRRRGALSAAQPFLPRSLAR